MRIVDVRLHERAYPIFVGAGARGQLMLLVGKLPGVRQIALICDERVAGLHLDKIRAGLEWPLSVLRVPPGEESKTLAQAGRLYDELARIRFGRKDLVVTFGGGVTGDLGGFVAATWVRGVRFIQVPTTLEAAIDASIGGKTGVNHAAGKNLIGAFHQPAAVLIDTEFLETLPQRDYIAGLGESVKHAIIRDPDLLGWHEEHAREIVERKPDVLELLIARNCEIKADVVARDEREDDLRMILNYGHTIGHAIEHLLGYALRHGECVALGILAENEIAVRRGLLADEDARRIAALIGTLGLPTRLPQRLGAERVEEVCRMDKKARSGAVHYVLVGATGEPVVVHDVTPTELAAGLEAINP